MSNTQLIRGWLLTHGRFFSLQSHFNQLPTGGLVVGGVKEQATQCLNHIKTIEESADYVLNDAVKINIQLKNIADTDEVNKVYKTFFNSELPAIPMDALVQIDSVVSDCEGTPPQG